MMKTQLLHSFKRFDSGWSPHSSKLCVYLVWDEGKGKKREFCVHLD